MTARLRTILVLGALLFLVGIPGPGRADEEPPQIEDNSFLIEEAYNQERNVVQHINTFQKMSDGSWVYTLTQEWPLGGQAHQLSYTIPVAHLTGPLSATGLGDVALNYRYQAVLDPRLAFAPRFTLLLPTGDQAKGLGSHRVGVQVNMPVSWRLSRRFETHWNVGATYINGNTSPGGLHRDTLGYNVGASLVYDASSKFNLLVEVLYSTNPAVTDAAVVDQRRAFLINPGMRFAIDCAGGVQIVPGLSFPIGIGPSRGQTGVFFYLSIEHPFGPTGDAPGEKKAPAPPPVPRKP